MSRFDAPETNPPRAGRAGSRAALAVLVLAGAIATATPASADNRLLVGMGDSYSTGAGIPPVDPGGTVGGADQCVRSPAAYPMVAADELGFAGQNVACGGAVLSDFTAPSRRGAPPQVSAIGDADVIAFTMGGNDVGGPGGVLESSRSVASMAAFAASVEALGPQLVAAYLDVQGAAPAAGVYVLGYPDIVPDTQQALESCLGARAAGLTASDIHHNVDLLNAVIADAAARTGAVFVATTPSFAGHEMCTNDAYANAPEEPAPASPGGGLHPNEAGHLAMAAALIGAIGGTDQPSPPPATPGPENPPATGPSPIPGPVLSPQERAAARAVAAALLERIRATGLGLGRAPVRFGGPS